MNLTLGLVAASDRLLEQLARSCATRVAAFSIGELSTLAHPGARPPDVLLVDLRREPKIPAALSLVTRQHPSIRVVILAAKLEPALVLDAMRAGVTECVTEPFAQADLHAAIARVVAEKAPAPVVGRVFAFVGAKGGIGTTMLATNVSTALAQLTGASTLLVDLQPGAGDAAVYLGVEPRFSVLDAVENTHRLDEAFFKNLVVRTPAGVDLLAAVPAGSSSPTPVQIAPVVEFARRHFQHVVLDLPRSGLGALNALDAAPTTVVVASQELATLRSAARLATALRHKYDKQQVKVVVGRYDALAEISAEDVERAVGTAVQVFPNEYRKVVAALNAGRPVVLEDHKLAGAITTFARELAGIATPKPPVERTAGLLRRFTPRMART